MGDKIRNHITLLLLRVSMKIVVCGFAYDYMVGAEERIKGHLECTDCD